MTSRYSSFQNSASWLESPKTSTNSEEKRSPKTLSDLQTKNRKRSWNLWRSWGETKISAPWKIWGSVSASTLKLSKARSFLCQDSILETTMQSSKEKRHFSTSLTNLSIQTNTASNALFFTSPAKKQDLWLIRSKVPQETSKSNSSVLKWIWETSITRGRSRT